MKGPTAAAEPRKGRRTAVVTAHAVLIVSATILAKVQLTQKLGSEFST